jgi:hypothetical protein
MLDTKEIAGIFRTYLRINNIGQNMLWKKLGFSSLSYFKQLLIRPKPWRKCSEIEKKVYHQMKNWPKSQEMLSSLKKSCSVKHRASFGPLNSNVSYNAANNATPLDTASIVKKASEILKKHKIPRVKLAEKYLGIRINNLNLMFKKSRRWEECTEYQKGVYRSIHEWSMSEKQIAALKNLQLNSNLFLFP